MMTLTSGGCCAFQQPRLLHLRLELVNSRAGVLLDSYQCHLQLSISWCHSRDLYPAAESWWQDGNVDMLTLAPLFRDACRLSVCAG